MEYKLSDLFELQMGKTPDRHTPEYWSNGKEQWISIADLSKCDKYIEETAETISEQAINESGIKIIPANTVIMSFKLSIGKVAITSRRMYSNEAIMAFIDKGVIPIEPTYLYFLLLAKDWDEGTNNAVMGKTLNKATLSQVKIRIHDVTEQREIVRVLEKAENIVAICKQQLITLDTLIKARFVEMFGEPETNLLGWREVPLSSLLNVVGGYAFKSEGFLESGIPVLRIGNINTGTFQPVNMVFWEDSESLSRYKIYPGDLVMSLTGTVGKDDYGNVCILGKEHSCYYLNQRNAKLELKPGLDKYYLAELLKFPEIKRRLTGISRGIRQANISNKDILNLIVPVPDMELQKAFATFVAQVDKSRLLHEKTLSKMNLFTYIINDKEDHSCQTLAS